MDFLRNPLAMWKKKDELWDDVLTIIAARWHSRYDKDHLQNLLDQIIHMVRTSL